MKRLTAEEQKIFKESFFSQCDGRWSVDWDDICRKAEETGSEIFLSNSWHSSMPQTFSSRFKLKRVELDELTKFTTGGYRFVIQVSKRD